ncbi:unnamed protein product [Prunus armeniaca]
MRLRFGMMTPTLLDLAAIAGLRPHGVIYSAADHPEPFLKPDYDKPNKNFNNWIKTHFGYTESSSRAPIGSTNGVSYTEHVAFLQVWLCKFLTCSKSSQVTKEVQPLAEALADGQAVALGPILPTFTDAFMILFCLNPCHATLQARFGFSTMAPSLLLGIGSSQCHITGYSQRSPSDLSMRLDHHYSYYLALDLASIPTLETKEERREL